MLQRTRSSSSLSSASQGSPSTKSRAGHQYSKKKLKGDTKLDTRLLRRVQRGEKPQNVTKLVKAGAQVDCADRVTGDRPLHIAVALGHTEMISALFRNGADVNATSAIGDTPLHIAAMYNTHAAMAALLTAGKGVRVNAQNDAGRTAFHLATMFNSYECWYMLLDAGASIDAVDNEGRTPLHIACSVGFSRAVSVLVHRGAKINHTNRVGNTPLHTAVLANDRSSVEALLSLGADTTRINLAGYNPFRMAVLFNKTQVLDALHHASPAAPASAAAKGAPASIVAHVRSEHSKVLREIQTQHRARAHTLNVSQQLEEVPPPVPPREKKKVVYTRSVSASSLRDDSTRNRILPTPPFDLPSRMSTRAQEM